MDAARAGWYDDPDHPGALRWFDGQGWTKHRMARPPSAATYGPVGWAPQGAPPGQWLPAGQPGPTSGNKALIVVLAVIGGLFLLAPAVAIAIPVYLNQREKAAVADLDPLTCDDVVAEAISTSAKEATGALIALVSVSDVKLLADGRDTLRLPNEDRRSFVMSCTGTGLWADDVTTPVTLTLSVDHELEHRVAIEWE